MSSATPADELRDHFLGWQCRVRQIAMRADGGRPSSGMRPRVLTLAGRELSPAITVLLAEREPAESTAFFRFQVQKSHDPRDIYERGLKFLQAEYFQQPGTFSGQLTAVLPGGSPLATGLEADGVCVLEFDQFRQFYRLPCGVHDLPPSDPARDAALWHNRLFNPALSDDVRVLAFQPGWAAAEARPGPSTWPP